MRQSNPGLTAEARRLLVPGNLRILAFSSMMTGIYVSMLNAFSQPFVVSNLGFSVAILGALVAVGARPSGLASSIVQPFAGLLADSLGRKRLIMFGSAVGICAMISFFFAATTRSLIPLSFGYFLFGLSLLGNPASQALTAETVGMDPQRVNIAFSLVFFFTALPGGITAFFVGPIVSTFGYAAIFVAAAFLESLNLLALFPYLRETRPPPQTIGATQAVRHLSLSQAFRIPRNLIRIFLPFAMDSFFYGIGGGIIFGMWSRSFGYTDGQIGVIYGTLAVSVVASQYFATRLLLAVGIRKTLAFSEFLTVVILLGWLTEPYYPVLIALSVLFGVSVALWVPAVSSLIMGAAPIEERGSVGGKLAAFRGLVAFPAPVIGGVIYSVYGYSVPVFLSLVGESITVLAILKLIPESKAPPRPPLPVRL